MDGIHDNDLAGPAGVPGAELARMADALYKPLTPEAELKMRVNLASFQYHQPGPEQQRKIEALRKAHTHLAELYHYLAPDSADRTAALRKLHEAQMTVIKSVILQDKH